MIPKNNKRFYKVISLFIKALILLLSFWYIWIKINEATLTIDYFTFIQHSNSVYLILACLLMPINWGIEAWKWKILIRPLEAISFSKAIKSIFSGVTISIFSPNRIGEFAGRIFFLEKADKIQASLKSFIGSSIQLTVTLLVGLTAIFVFYRKGFGSNHPITFNVWMLIGLFILLFFGLIILWLVLRTNSSFSSKIKKTLHVLFLIERSELSSVIALSLIRYLVFSVQYYLVLFVFNIHLDFSMAFMLIAITFLVASAIPTFAISEIAVRSATAVYFFSIVTDDSTGVMAASLLLWVINLALPALIGGVYVWKLKFFQD